MLLGSHSDQEISCKIPDLRLFLENQETQPQGLWDPTWQPLAGVEPWRPRQTEHMLSESLEDPCTCAPWGCNIRAMGLLLLQALAFITRATQPG